MFSPGDGRRFSVCEDLCDLAGSAPSSGLYFMAGNSSLVSNALPPALQTGSQPSLAIVFANLRTTSGYFGRFVTGFLCNWLKCKHVNTSMIYN